MNLIDKYSSNTPILVAGAGGFIGGHLVNSLQNQGFTSIQAIDIKPTDSWFQKNSVSTNIQSDLSNLESCINAVQSDSLIFNLAADMGGMGFIEQNKLKCMLSVLINTHLLQAATRRGAQRYFFASSACVYRADKQQTANVTPLKEEDAYPAMPEDGYGWEKLFSERMCRHFSEDAFLDTRVARFHNVYGPNGTYAGGREKAPAAICRKIAMAQLTGDKEIEIWGDGQQTRSFMYIEDAIEGIQRLMISDVSDPMNIGSDRLVSINELVDIVEDIAGIKCKRSYITTAPLGVRGRNSDNTFINSSLDWTPSIPLETGLEKTYRWIYDILAHSASN